VLEAEFLKQHDFQDAFKNGRGTRNCIYTYMEADYFEVDGGQ
jgi:hypothetical protein